MEDIRKFLQSLTDTRIDTHTIVMTKECMVSNCTVLIRCLQLLLTAGKVLFLDRFLADFATVRRIVETLPSVRLEYEWRVGSMSQNYFPNNSIL